MKLGGTRDLIKIAFRNIWRNKRRTAFCFSAVGIAVFFIVVYSSLIDGMTQSMSEIVQVFELGHVRVVSATTEAEKEYMPVQYPILDGKSWREMAVEIMEHPIAHYT
jgi:putative ABC transport system permease protein